MIDINKKEIQRQYVPCRLVRQEGKVRDSAYINNRRVKANIVEWIIVYKTNKFIICI